MRCPHGIGMGDPCDGWTGPTFDWNSSRFREQADARRPVEGDQLTIEAYWGPGDGTSPRWGESWGEIAIRADDS